METRDDLNGAYPTGYEHVEQSVSETIRRVRDIDRQIETTPQNSKRTPAPKPPGVSITTPIVNRERTINLLQAQKEGVQAEAWAKIEEDTKKPNDKAARVARDNAREALFPNPFRDMSIEERKGAHGKSRDIQMSQDYMDAKRLEKASERSGTPQSKNPAVETKGEQAVSAAERYSRSLKYDYIRQGREMTERTPDHRQDKDRG